MRIAVFMIGTSSENIKIIPSPGRKLEKERRARKRAAWTF
jgi:hypothetical protein